MLLPATLLSNTACTLLPTQVHVSLTDPAAAAGYCLSTFILPHFLKGKADSHCPCPNPANIFTNDIHLSFINIEASTYRPEYTSRLFLPFSHHSQ
jgi:hypothetical protein